MTAIAKNGSVQLLMGAATVTGAHNIGSLTAAASDTFTAVPQTKKVDPPQSSQSSSKEPTLDGVQLVFGSIVQWSDCEFVFSSAYTQTPHTNLIADTAVAGGRFRNFRTIEPDAGNRQTDFIGACMECKGDPYEAAEEASGRNHSGRIVVHGTPTVTP